MRNGIHLLLMALFLTVVIHAQSAPVSPKPLFLQINQHLGVKDALAYVPGITAENVCSTCLRVFNAIRNEGSHRTVQDRTKLMTIVKRECAAFGKRLESVLKLNTPGAFCQELGVRILQVMNDGALKSLAMIHPNENCKFLTMC